MSNLDDLPKKLVELKGSASAKESKVSKPAKAQPKKAATKKITAKAQVKPKATTNKPAAKPRAATKKSPAKTVRKRGGAPLGTPKKGGFTFPIGNKFWQCRAKHGRDGIWTDPADLLADCISYFEWLDENPLLEEKGFAFQGVVTKETFSKMRAATLDGLHLHLGISDDTWRSYRTKPDFSGVCEYVDKAIRNQKFAGAAADLLNASIIARDLGLKDNIQAEHTGAEGGPIQVVERRIVRVGDRHR